MSVLNLPSRLVMRTQGHCNICNKQRSSSSFVFFEEDQLSGWQCCQTCHSRMPDIVQNATKYWKKHMDKEGRTPIYICLKPNVNLPDEFCLKKTHTGHHEIKLKIQKDATSTFYTNCSYFRMSKSMNKLIWVDRFGSYKTLKNLVRLNPEIFGICFEKSIFEINFDIEDMTQKNELIGLINSNH